MIQLSHVFKSFGTQTVLEDITLKITSQSRIGLIGRNGCGKSTLLKLLMGVYDPDAGSLSKTPRLQVNCLTQEPQVTLTNTLEEEVKSVFGAYHQLVAEEAELLAKVESLTGEPQMAALHRLDTVHQHMAHLNPQTMDAEISKMLTSLGFTLDQLTWPVSQFSGGWQMRINLAKVLLEGADILLLDEPTNHLDLEACEALESFLKTYTGGLVIVSHDRRFLDAVTTEIAEVELGKLTLWPGNYSAYLEQKADWVERQTTAAERQHKELAKQQAFVDRFRASATKSTQAKSREKQLAKIERIVAPKTDQRHMAMQFPVAQASGKQVITLRNVHKAFGTNTLLSGAEADLQRGERVFLLGANGCGKTTLFRMILGLEPLDLGEIRPGHNVEIGYFSQNQLETLDASLTPFETIHAIKPQLTNGEVRSLLARFLFAGDEVFKPVSVLSGGEKSKLALAKLMLTGPNTLLLDEPTNHMDIPAKEALEAVFKTYEGTILCISHDRYLIQELATDIWEIYRGHLIKYGGDYNYYLEKRTQFRGALDQQLAPKAPLKVEPVVQKPVKTSPLKPKREIEKDLNKTEKQIMALEAEIMALEAELAAPELQQDYVALEALSQTLHQKQDTLASLNTQWEVLAEAFSAHEL